MKNIRSITLIVAFACLFLSTSLVKAQSITKKVAKEDIPKKVKETLKLYSNHQFENEATLSSRASLKKGTKKTKSEKVYRFKFKGNRSGEVLVINKKGKVVAIETGEPNN